MWNAYPIERTLTHLEEETSLGVCALTRLQRDFDAARQQATHGMLDVPAHVDVDDFMERLIDVSRHSQVVNGLACKVLVLQLGSQVVSLETSPATRQLSWKVERHFNDAVERARRVSLYEKFLLIEYDILTVAEQCREDIPALLEMMDTTRQHLMNMAN